MQGLKLQLQQVEQKLQTQTQQAPLQPSQQLPQIPQQTQQVPEQQQQIQQPTQPVQQPLHHIDSHPPEPQSRTEEPQQVHTEQLIQQLLPAETELPHQTQPSQPAQWPQSQVTQPQHPSTPLPRVNVKESAQKVDGIQQHAELVRKNYRLDTEDVGEIQKIILELEKIFLETFTELTRLRTILQDEGISPTPLPTTAM